MQLGFPSSLRRNALLWTPPLTSNHFLQYCAGRFRGLNPPTVSASLVRLRLRHDYQLRIPWPDLPVTGPRCRAPRWSDHKSCQFPRHLIRLERSKGLDGMLQVIDPLPLLRASPESVSSDSE